MSLRAAKLMLPVLLALGAAAGVHAQERDQAVLPVWNNDGQIEALLVLEPTDDTARAGARWRLGSGNSLDATFGLEAGDSLALLCNHQGGLAVALGNLANNCSLASLDDNVPGGQRSTATAAFNRPEGRVGVTVGDTSGNLPAWLASGSRAGAAQVDGNDLTVFAQRNISDQGYVSIAGTVAKARLIPYAQAPAGMADRWDSRSLRLGGGYGNFGASVIGQVTDTPGRERFDSLGLGLTWRTPWSGQLTVGADNLVTRGRNPFAPNINGRTDEGTVPYIRYEQDL